MGENAEHLKEGVQLYNQGKAREVLDRYDDTAVLEFEGSIIGGTYKGKQGVADFMKKIGGVYPAGLHLKIENLVEHGDTVVAEWTTTGTLTNGKQLKTRQVNVFEYRAGKVVSHRGFGGSEELARAPGRL